MSRWRANLFASLCRWVALAIPVLGLGLLSSGCGPVLKATGGDFWLEAARTTVQVEPALPLPEEGTVTVWTSRVVVVDNSAPRRPGMPQDYTMELLPIDGDAFGKPMALHYRLGGKRRIPLERGQLARLTIWRSLQAGSSAPAEAFVLETWQRLQAVDQRPLVAVIDINGLLPKTLLPAALQRIEPGLEVVYQTSERPSGECYRSVAHRQFQLAAGTLPDDRVPRLASPGERLTLADLQAEWDVVLLDHRQTLRSTCGNDAESWWGWAAIRSKTGSGFVLP